MYSYDFKSKEEKVLYEKRDAIVEIKDKTYELSVVVTNKNLLFFNNANKFHALNSRAISIQPEYLLELTIPLENLKYSVEDGNTYIFYQDTDIIIYNFELKNC